MIARLCHRWRVARRLAHLNRLIARSSQVRMAWIAEFNYIRGTGRLDWEDPTSRIDPHDVRLKPPPRPRSGRR